MRKHFVSSTLVAQRRAEDYFSRVMGQRIEDEVLIAQKIIDGEPENLRLWTMVRDLLVRVQARIAHDAEINHS
jgi:hypothetical protein